MFFSRLHFSALLQSCLLSTSVLLVGCSEDAGDDIGGIDPGVGQGGAQDFGLFRDILDRGEIPGPATIDAIGFFNEHKIELPPAECGQDVCIHGMLGVMGNMITGSNCTMVLLGMNTSVDPSNLDRPPLNLTIAVDASGSMKGDPLRFLQSGLRSMLPALQAEDRVSLLTFDDEAEILIEASPGSAPELANQIDRLKAGGNTNIYAGLRLAYESAAEHYEEGRQNRIILLSDGVATTGIENRSRIEALSEAYAHEGFGLTTVGVGDDFDVELMRRLSENGGGSFYFLEDPKAIEEVFVEEVQSFLVPIAHEAEIEIDIHDGYELRAIYGTNRSEIDNNTAQISIPTLQIAHRDGSEDQNDGRRGGGGAILLELLPTGKDPEAVGEIAFTYHEPIEDNLIDQQSSIRSPLKVWETPEEGFFSNQSVEKAFVMLNVFVGFQLAAERAAVGNDNLALSTLKGLEENLSDWLTNNPDTDIENDLTYLRIFIENLEMRSSSTAPANPEEPWPFD